MPPNAAALARSRTCFEEGSLAPLRAHRPRVHGSGRLNHSDETGAGACVTSGVTEFELGCTVGPSEGGAAPSAGDNALAMMRLRSAG